LVVNEDLNGIKGYIGGNSFLEMGFAHVLNKKIFLLNPISEMGYEDEIVAMKPVILNGDLDKII
jgi:predicted RNA-binding protein with PUA domain